MAEFVVMSKVGSAIFLILIAEKGGTRDGGVKSADAKFSL